MGGRSYIRVTLQEVRFFTENSNDDDSLAGTCQCYWTADRQYAHGAR